MELPLGLVAILNALINEIVSSVRVAQLDRNFLKALSVTAFIKFNVLVVAQCVRIANLV
jgi:hypothetical protein